MSKVVLAAFVFSALCLSALAGDEVSRDLPLVYRDRLAPLLTPAAKAMKFTDDFAARDDASIALLFETLRFVDTKGATCLALHRIDRVRNEQGVARVAKDEIAFRKSDQRIHLILARSIQEDGSSQDVAPNAAFLQSPQRDGDSSVFTDYGELVLLYPNVRPGTTCESIVVIEDPVGRIPGEFTARLSFAALWPQARVRHVIELEKPLADRLAVNSLGNVPIPDRNPIAGGMRLTWLADHIPKTRMEPQRAPVDQIGPAVYLTTINDWNAFGAWYSTLLEGRDKTHGPLADRIAAKTKDANTTPAIVAALLVEAAREVRYTGLEFGISGLQPQDPNLVWTNRYGDCKDKANLLRAMLHEKNVPSYLALVNTAHAGRIEKRSPDYRHFDHAILAVPLGDGKYLFCDPTLKYARPGMLRPDDSDRDVLLIKDGAVEFVHTPTQDAGLIRYDFDMKMAPDGGLSGWMTIEARDYNGALWMDYFANTQQRETLRERALAIAQGFFRSAQLVDVDPMPVEKWSGVYRLRAYFLVPASGSAGQGRESLGFPVSDSILPDFGDSKDRLTVYWQETEAHEVHCKIQMPAGWSSVDLPRPFQVATPAISASARWEAQGSTVSSFLEFQTHVSVVPPERFPLLYNAVTSLRVWLGKPLEVRAGRDSPTTSPTTLTTTSPATLPATSPATQPELTDFPMLVTGDGQLDLVDRRFPLEGSLAERRLALQKVLQWFPQDVPTRFLASFRLEEVELKIHPNDPAALARVGKLLNSSKNDADPDSFAWAEFRSALWQYDAGRKADGLAVLTRQAADTHLSAFRRGWASVYAARLLADDDRDKAIAILQASFELDSSVLPTQYAELADIRLRQQKPELLKQQLAALVQTSPQQAGSVFSKLIGEAERLHDDDRSTDANTLLLMLEALITGHDELAQLRDELAPLKGRLGLAAALDGIAGSLQRHLANHPLDWWAKTVLDPKVKTREQYLQAILKRAKEPGVDLYLKYALEYLTHFPPDPKNFPERLWRLSNSLEIHDRDPELLQLLLDAMDRLPDTNDWFYEGKLLRARVLSKKKKDDDAIAIYNSVAASEKTDVSLRHAALNFRGELFERRHRYSEAVATYQELEANPTANTRSIDALLRAAFIHLETANPNGALRIGGVLAKVSDKEINAADNGAQVRALIELTQSPALATAYWRRQEAWWPLWLELEKKMDFPALDDALIIPAIADSAAQTKEFEQAERANDLPRVQAIMRNLAHCARWLPRNMAGFAGLYGSIGKISPPRQVEFRKLLLVALRDFEFIDVAVVRVVQEFLAFHQLGSGDYPATLETLRAYRAKRLPAHVGDFIDRYMNRLWAQAVVLAKQNTDEAAHALEADLAGTEQFSDRAESVQWLDEIYKSSARSADEMRLLKIELDNPTVKNDAAITEGLRKRYQTLQDIGPTLEFNKTVAEWMSGNKPAWYDFAHPKDLTAYASQDLDALIPNPPASLTRPEIFKFRMLIAESAAQPLKRRIDAFEWAVYQLAQLAQRHSEQRRIFATVLAATTNDSIRRSTHWMAAFQAAKRGDDLAPFLSSSLADQWAATDRRQIAHVAAIAACREKSAIELENEMALLSGAPLGPDALEIYGAAFRRLVQLDPARARQALNAADRIELAPETPDSAPAVRVTMRRHLAVVERFGPADRALRDLAVAQFADSSVGTPADWMDCRFTDNLGHLDRRVTLGIDLELLRSSRMGPGDLQFWKELVHNAAPEGNGSFGLSALAALLANLSEDEDRARVILECDAFFDDLNPSEHERGTAILRPYFDAAQCPITRAAVRIHDIRRQLRLGQPVDLDQELRDIQHPLFTSLVTSLRIAQCVRDRSVARLQSLLAAMPPEALTDVANLPELLPALDLAGLSDEATVLREAGRKRLAADVIQSWASLSQADILRALALAKALDAPDEIPPAWVKDCFVKVDNTELKHRMLMETSMMRSDWTITQSAADRLLRECPGFHRANWYKGLALYQLDRRADAIPPLETFVRLCNDQPEHARAVELLAKLKTP